MAEITEIKATENDTAPAPKAKPKKRRRRLGDRSDGRRLRTIHPMSRIACYIMEDRTGSTNRVRDRIDLSNIDRYVREKKAQGYKNFNLMHVIIAAYVRVLAGQPALNRFIAGHNIFARNKVEVALTIKKEMTLESPDTVVKVIFEPDATVEDVYNKLNDAVTAYRDNPGGDFDKTAGILSYVPAFLLNGFIGFIRGLDYFGLLPKFLEGVSPFHCSMFITSMGSLGIPPIYHHLYNFGTCPVFIAFGAKKREFKLDADGSVTKEQYMDISFSLDERICDGFYYASALKAMKYLIKNPEELDVPPAKVVEDIR